jgi:rhodanese-related sulfurtransferase
MKNSFFLIAAFFTLQSCATHAQITTLSVDDFEKGIACTEIQLLDVRTAEEYKSGHLTNALQANWNNTAEFQERVKAIDKTKPIYVYCLGGGRSNAAMQWLNKNGYTVIFNMAGGINAWKQANKAVEGSVQIPQIALVDFLATIPKNKTVLVDISAKWCPPCKQMLPIIAQLEKENYTILQIDGGAQTELAKQLKATAFPTFIRYKNGVEEGRKEGIVTLEDLKVWLK